MFNTVYMYMYVYVYVCMYGMYTVYMYMYVCMACIYIYMYIHLYVYIIPCSVRGVFTRRSPGHSLLHFLRQKIGVSDDVNFSHSVAGVVTS